jgi:hypothetical protein
MLKIPAGPGMSRIQILRIIRYFISSHQSVSGQVAEIRDYLKWRERRVSQNYRIASQLICKDTTAKRTRASCAGLVAEGAEVTERKILYTTKPNNIVLCFSIFSIIVPPKTLSLVMSANGGLMHLTDSIGPFLRKIFERCHRPGLKLMMSLFLEGLRRKPNIQDWQVSQARDAIKLYEG